MCHDFFVWRKNKLYLKIFKDFCDFDESTNFDISDVIIDISSH